MDCFRNEFFSRSRFALNEHGTVEACNGIHKFEDAMHRSACTDNVVEAVFLVELLTEVLILKPQLAFHESLANHNGQFDEFEGLREVVVCALLDGGYSGLDRAISRDDDANRFGISNEGFFQKLDAGFTWKVMIGDENVVCRLRQLFCRFLGTGCLFDLETVECQDLDYCATKFLFIVYYQNLFL